MGEKAEGKTASGGGARFQADAKSRLEQACGVTIRWALIPGGVEIKKVSESFNFIFNSFNAPF